jgi:hypothetical protein
VSIETKGEVLMVSMTDECLQRNISNSWKFFDPKLCFTILPVFLLTNCVQPGTEGPNAFGPYPGSYSGAYDYSKEQFQTREIHFWDSIKGDAQITLRENGEVVACFGVLSKSSHSMSKYVPGQNENKNEYTEDRWLLGARGRWEAVNELSEIRIHLGRSWFDSCGEKEGEPLTQESFNLKCVLIGENHGLYQDTLACMVEGYHSMLKKITLSSMDSQTAVPYALQQRQVKQSLSSLGEPWILLGKKPGLMIHSKQDHRMNKAELSFKKKQKKFAERNYWGKKK